MPKDEARQRNNPSVTVDADRSNAIREVTFNFWSDPTMTEDAAIAALHGQFDTILNEGPLSGGRFGTLAGPSKFPVWRR